MIDHESESTQLLLIIAHAASGRTFPFCPRRRIRRRQTPLLIFFLASSPAIPKHLTNTKLSCRRGKHESRDDQRGDVAAGSWAKDDRRVDDATGSRPGSSAPMLI
ncbi:hypothetical protein PIB30_061909, partial [Stylosanthes scabra]|nr:hypothetical protein [Stylosanthes scabra]